MPGWDNQKAGTIFEQMLVKTSNKIDGVAAANDGLANAVVVALKAHKLKPIPLSGQDATDAGRPEHHLGLADDDGLEGRRGSSRPTTAQAAIAHRQGPEAADDGHGHDQGPREGAGLPDPAAVDHEGELQACSSRAAS